MSIIIMIIVGFIVGLIARAIMPGDQNMGIIMTTILGIIGAVVAGFGQGLRLPLLPLSAPHSATADRLATLVQALEAYTGALIVVSHDEDFCRRIRIDRTLTL